MIVIYGLTDPRDGAVRYIGKTARKLKVRLSSHLSEARRATRPSHREKWLRKLLKLGREPGIVALLEVLPTETWQECERRVIAQYRNLGFRLVNGTSGGDGVEGRKWKPTREQAARAAAARRGLKRSDRAKQMTSETLKRLYRTDPVKAAQRRGYAAAAAKSDAARAAASARMKSIWADPLRREQMAAAMRGVPKRRRRGGTTEVLSAAGEAQSARDL